MFAEVFVINLSQHRSSHKTSHDIVKTLESSSQDDGILFVVVIMLVYDIVPT